MEECVPMAYSQKAAGYSHRHSHNVPCRSTRTRIDRDRQRRVLTLEESDYPSSRGIRELDLACSRCCLDGWCCCGYSPWPMPDGI